jgi:hypothetical protein
MSKQSQTKRLKRGLGAVMRFCALSVGLPRQPTPRRYFLGILAVMRNEAPIIREWMETHIQEGVQQFFIIDHQSTDNWQERVRDFIDRGFVTAVYATGTNLDDVRADHAHPALASCEWLLVVDLDEFTYARGAETIASFLRTLPGDVAQVKIPWLMFGTSGNQQQPKSIVKHCRRREDIANHTEGRWHAKSAIRPARLLMLKIHAHLVKGRTIAPLPGLPEVDDGPFLPWPMRKREHELILAQNHYNLQSREQFEEKSRRDGYTTGGVARKYTETYFETTERLNNAVQDDALHSKYSALFEHIETVN